MRVRWDGGFIVRDWGFFSFVVLFLVVGEWSGGSSGGGILLNI